MKFLKKTGQILIIGIIFYFIGMKLLQNWHEISNQQYEINSFLIIFASIIWIFSFLFCAYIWAYIIKRMNSFKNWKQGIQIWLYSQIAKYVPGKVAGYIGRYYFCKKQNIDIKVVTTSLFLESILNPMASILLCILVLPFIKIKSLSENNITLMLIILAVGFIVIQPKIFYKILNFILRLFKKEQIIEELVLKDIFIFIIMYLFYWIIDGISFFFFLSSIGPISSANLPIMIVINSLSWVIGYISFLTPSGIGVREGAMSFLLSFYFPLPMAILISLLHRVWLTLCEIIIIGIVYLFDKKKHTFTWFKVKKETLWRIKYFKKIFLFLVARSSNKTN